MIPKEVYTMSPSYPVLVTSRIVLRELTLDDVSAVFHHFADPDVTRFMDIEPCKDVAEAAEIIQFHLDDAGCRWGLFSKKDHSLMGTCGFHCWDKENGQAEIGFDLSKSYWGQGLMKEALEAVIAYGFQAMNLKLIEATVETDNVRCQKLLDKLAFKRAVKLKDHLYDYYLESSNGVNDVFPLLPPVKVMRGETSVSVLGERLKILREERGWSQTYVSQQLGMKRSSTYANWEYGLRDPDTETLVKLAWLFQVTTDYLTGASDNLHISQHAQSARDELDMKLIKAIMGLSREDKEYVLGFIEKIKRN